MGGLTMMWRMFTKIWFFVASLTLLTVLFWGSESTAGLARDAAERRYNGPYFGPYLNRVAFPIGGMGAGMVCLEGTGAVSHVSVRNKPEVFDEPHIYAALCVKGKPNLAKVLEDRCLHGRFSARPALATAPQGRVLVCPGSENPRSWRDFPLPPLHLKTPKSLWKCR